MRRFALLLILFSLSFSMVACSASTANVSGADLARGYTDGKATDVTTTFAQTDNPIHFVVTLSNAPDDTNVKAVWTAVDANDGQIKDQKIDETTLQSGSGTLNFTLANNNAAWPKGKYKVDLFLNDKSDRTVDFNVE